MLTAGLDRPLTLIILSAALNGFVMFLYSGLLLWMNWRSFEPPLRPSPLRVVALLSSFAAALTSGAIEFPKSKAVAKRLDMLVDFVHEVTQQLLEKEQEIKASHDVKGDDDA